MSRAGIYENPVRRDFTDPDPFILRHRGRYYCYSTGLTQVNVSVSTDMVSWHDLGAALTVEGRDNFWAPCVIYHNGEFLMYVSFRPEGSPDPHKQRMHLATSRAPQGPFHVADELFDFFAIDADVVPNAAGGWTMFYSTNQPTGLEDEFTGTSILADHMPDVRTLSREPWPVITPSLQQELFLEDRFGDGRDWFTIEGPATFEHDGTWFMTYSGNAYEREDYFVGHATAPACDVASQAVWEKFPDPDTFEPLVRRTDMVEGTGHNSITVAPNLVDHWMVYHGRDARQELAHGTEQRQMRIDPLIVGSKRLWALAPSVGPQPAPRGPSTRQAAASFSSSDGRVQKIVAEGLRSYIAEVWTRTQRSDLGARIGVVVWAQGNNRIEVLWDDASATLTAVETHSNVRSVTQRCAIADLQIDEWQQWSIRRTRDRVVVRVGPWARLDLPVPPDPAGFGLSAVRTDAAFEAVAVTRHERLSGLDLKWVGGCLRPEGEVGLSPAGLAGSASAPVTMSGSLPAEFRIEQDLEILGRDGMARFVLRDMLQHVDLAIDSRTARLLINGAESHELKLAGRHHHVTVSRSSEAAMLIVDTHRIDLPRFGTSATQELSLAGARLLRFTATELTHFNEER